MPMHTDSPPLTETDTQIQRMRNTGTAHANVITHIAHPVTHPASKATSGGGRKAPRRERLIHRVVVSWSGKC